MVGCAGRTARARTRDYLRAVREGELPVTAVGVSLLIEGTQQLEQIVNAHRASAPASVRHDPRADCRCAAAEQAADAPPSTAAAQWNAMDMFVYADARAARAGHGCRYVRRRLAELGTITGVALVMPDGSIVFHFTVDAAAERISQQRFAKCRWSWSRTSLWSIRSPPSPQHA
jgi:hypothetical protein